MYDLLIIGGGVAGITAGIYAKRANKKVAIIEKYVPGGQIDTIGLIENYPGFSSITGSALAQNLYNHCKNVEVEFVFDEVKDVNFLKEFNEVVCSNSTYKTKSIIFAMGCSAREINVDGEKRFFGKGVSYCAMCDGAFFKNKDVAVVGSGDGAVSNALYLSNMCSNVHLFAKSELKLINYTQQDLNEKTNITVHKNVMVKDFFGNEKLEGLTFAKNDVENKCNVDGIFVCIGRVPPTDFLKDKIELDTKGYIVCNNDFETNINGVFACGDVVSGSTKQIVVAASSGAEAVKGFLNYINKK